MPLRPARLTTAVRRLAFLVHRPRRTGLTGLEPVPEPEQEQASTEPPSPLPEPAPPGERLAAGRREREAELAATLTGVVRHGGLLAQADRIRLPGQRLDDNLAEVAGALGAAGIDHGIVPDRGRRHRLAVAAGDRSAALEALSVPFAGQAVYADLLEHGRVLATVLAEQVRTAVAVVEREATGPGELLDAEPGATPPDRVKGLRIYRPAVVGTLLYGSEAACDVEFWDPAPQAPGAVASIDETPLGWWVPSLEATARTAVGGQVYPLVNAFAVDLPDRVAFPVDAVITWVDDTDPAWQRRRDTARAGLARTAAPVAPEDGDAASGIAGDADQRFRNRDELRYCLRALAAHAPWIRHVHLVTDDQTPPWLDTDRPGLTVVPHRDLFAGTDAGPVFNSHAIESRLHLIPGLAEHFLYINDDVFLGRTVAPEDFFLGNGLPLCFPDDRIIPPGDARSDDSIYVAALKNTRAALTASTGKTYPRTLKHAPHPLRRSVMAESAERFAAELRATVRSPFRAGTDLAPVTLAAYYAHATARAVDGHLYGGYFVTDSHEDLARLADLHEERWADYFCLADGIRDRISPQAQHDALTGFLSEYFPVPSPFETGPARTTVR
ncbi:stealth conserved region 3 domain-containing protein [Kitasatospora sp. NPDC089913]|uniref:stealth family protein n=1 Tax=Kitasatospora sp. NPDC089913 TaxID=3364080 RepID=UPI003826AA77